MPLPITIVYLQIMHHKWAIAVTDVQVYSGVGYSLFLPIILIRLYSWEYTSTNISKSPHQDFNGISFCRPRMALTCVQWPRKATSHGAYFKGGIGNEENEKWRIGLELIVKGIVPYSTKFSLDIKFRSTPILCTGTKILPNLISSTARVAHQEVVGGALEWTRHTRILYCSFLGLSLLHAVHSSVGLCDGGRR